jgi:hypothetical protein
MSNQKDSVNLYEAMLKEADTLRKERDELQKDWDCKSGSEDCSLYNEKGYPCYRHLHHSQEALQEKVKELEEERWKVVATRNAACKRAEQVEAREKVLREAGKLIVDAYDIMDDGPDESDKALAMCRFDDGLTILKQALNTKE